MLQTQAVNKELLELLKKIMQSVVFDDFILVGGTGLALQIGHRESVDIDMFGNCEIDEELFAQTLRSFGSFEVIKKSERIFICSINGIRVDLVNYSYPLLIDYVTVEGLRIASKEDIAAMKLNAIAGRGKRKDFIDLYFLLNLFSLDEMIGFYLRKYFDGSKFQVIKSLIWFSDAETELAPVIFGNFDWEACKARIRNEVRNLKH
jgi:hypothetical protein